MTIQLSGRVATRFETCLPAQIKLPGEQIACESVNLSRSGALLTGRFPLPLDSPLELTLMSSSQDVEFRVKARIARVLRNDDGTASGVGIEFLAADDTGQPGLEAILSRVVEGCGSGALEGINPMSRPEEVRVALSKMALTHKVTLSMRASALERRYLRRDGNPKVLEALARNPSSNIEEVLSLARMHQILPTSLGYMVNDHRWSNSEELMIVIASHPKATLQQAEKAAGRLNDRAMDRLLQRPNLDVALRTKLLSPAGRKRLRQ